MQLKYFNPFVLNGSHSRVTLYPLVFYSLLLWRKAHFCHCLFKCLFWFSHWRLFKFVLTHVRKVSFTHTCLHRIDAPLTSDLVVSLLTIRCWICVTYYIDLGIYVSVRLVSVLVVLGVLWELTCPEVKFQDFPEIVTTPTNCPPFPHKSCTLGPQKIDNRLVTFQEEEEFVVRGTILHHIFIAYFWK